MPARASARPELGTPRGAGLDGAERLGQRTGVRNRVWSSRRSFLVATAATLTAACTHKAPRVPTRAVPPSPGQPDLRAELLDTEDGAIPIDVDDPQMGSRQAPCVIVVFSDFQCPFCREVATSLHQLHREQSGRLRVVFKHLPIPIHPDAARAALAAQVVWLEAGTEGFWRFHDRCFEHPHELDVDHLTTWASEVGVRMDAFERRAQEAERQVRQHIELAMRLDIRGTPRLYINRRRVVGAYPYEQLRSWVQEELG